MHTIFKRCLATFFALSASSVGQATAADRQFECVARMDDVGRKEPSASAALQRWADGLARFRMIEKGSEAYYYGEDPPRSGSEWIELYGAQSMRANSYRGNYRKDRFNCAPL